MWGSLGIMGERQTHKNHKGLKWTLEAHAVLQRVEGGDKFIIVK